MERVRMEARCDRNGFGRSRARLRSVSHDVALAPSSARRADRIVDPLTMEDTTSRRASTDRPRRSITLPRIGISIAADTGRLRINGRGHSRAGKRVDVRIIPVYEGSSRRPSYDQCLVVGGWRGKSLRFPNERAEKSRAKR